MMIEVECWVQGYVELRRFHITLCDDLDLLCTSDYLGGSLTFRPMRSLGALGARDPAHGDL